MELLLFLLFCPLALHVGMIVVICGRGTNHPEAPMNSSLSCLLIQRLDGAGVGWVHCQREDGMSGNVLEASLTHLASGLSSS